MAKEGSLAARYCLILADLRTQVLKQTEGLQRDPNLLQDDLLDNSTAGGADFFSSLNDSMQIPHQDSGIGDFEVIGSGQFNPMVSSTSNSRINLMLLVLTVRIQITAAFGGLGPFLYNDMLWS